MVVIAIQLHNSKDRNQCVQYRLPERCQPKCAVGGQVRVPRDLYPSDDPIPANLRKAQVEAEGR